MKIKIITLVFWSVLLLLLGSTIGYLIGRMGIQDQNVSKDSGQQQSAESQSGVIFVDRWNMFAGSLDITEASVPPVVEVEEKETGEFILDGRLYKQYKTDTYKIDFFYNISANCWHMDLSHCSIIGKTQDGIEIIGPNVETSLVICLSNEEERTALLLMRPDIIENGVSVFDLDDFDIYWDGQSSFDNTLITSLWELHTGYQEYPIAGPMLDGDWELHRLIMVLKECPALIYEFNVGICEDELYIKNLNCQDTICVPIDQILG